MIIFFSRTFFSLMFFEEIADGQINACKSAMFETGDYEVSCLFRNCSEKTSVWHLFGTTQKENKPMQAECT
ncbi:hypothetical protein BpHYR1_027039 [Brachionus plicatilis]|uniref:Secreted protein n=1 Tax=Brachionus plicatilis TaxID=10195 RepID=A0A3M7R9L8_BRAPC|nr:hypothetical protein BpHYR1_027039 [Brachionus plicatilis]